MADLKAIKEKLDALLARARDSGSSQAEVEACLKRAEKLMAQYGISEADLEDESKLNFRDYTFNVREGRKAHDPVIRYCAPYVGKMTGVTFYISGTGNTAPIIAFGLDADVEYALWLLKSLRTFMDDQWTSYVKWELGNCGRAELKQHRIGFVRGFTRRVNERIKEMTYRAKEGGGVGTGTDLVVKKNDIVKRELSNRGLNLGRGRNLSGRGTANADAAAAGSLAGNSASLGRGVGHNSIAIGDGR